MASPFDRAIAVAAVMHDRVQGELFTFVPQKYQTDRNAPQIPDTDRAIVEHVLCPFGDGAARAAGGPFHQVGVQPERAGLSTSRPYVSLNLSMLPWRPRQGDIVTREKAEQRYRVSEVLPSTPGFVRLSLNGVS
ncbi:MAG: hypothetical protein WA418_01690 [Bradyrhizobium sp.]